MQFNQLGLIPTLLEAIQSSGYSSPTKIQAAAVPAILSGQDVLAAAQTGTGKTAGFTLPLLQLLSGQHAETAAKCPRALILTPTRELAAQVYKSIQTYGKNVSLRSTVVFGGVNISPQRRALSQGVDILVATPGRLLDLHQQKALRLDRVEILVLDEADRMLDMGFIHDIRRIQKLLPVKRQNLMFSATFSESIRTLAKTICINPVEIDVAPRNSTVAAITQELYMIPKDKKAHFLSQFLSEYSEQVLVFSRTKSGANTLAKRLNKVNIHAVALHGNKSQNQRTKALEEFKQNKVQILVATDIAARGIDIQQLGLVINFDLPHVPEDYVHRIGRTGRAGASGRAISLASPEENKQLRAIEKLLRNKLTRVHADIKNIEVDEHTVKAEPRKQPGANGRIHAVSSNHSSKTPSRRRDRKRRFRTKAAA